MNQPPWRGQNWPLSCDCPPGEKWKTVKPGKNGFVNLAILLVASEPTPGRKATVAQKKADFDAWRAALVDLAWVLGKRVGLPDADFSPLPEKRKVRVAKKNGGRARKT